jgi:uncharacterized membrane protein YqjE
MRAQVDDDRSLGDLVTALVTETSTLVRQEVQLAKAEVRESAAQVGRDIAALLVGGAVIYAGFLALLAAVIVALAAAGLSRWLAALVVGGIVTILGAVLVVRGRRALQASRLVPRQTLRTLKEDEEWAKEQIA